MKRNGWPALTKLGQVTPQHVRDFKSTGTVWVGGSVYEQMDTLWATLAGMEILLIGDSLANIKLAHPNTADVSMGEMLTFTKACLRAAAWLHHVHPGTRLPLFVFDIPYCRMSSPEDGVAACYEALDASVDIGVSPGAVKIEIHQNDPAWREKVAALRESEIPFIAHIGYTPQVVEQIDPKIVQGKSLEGALYLAQLTSELQNSGAFAIFVESVPWQIGKLLTQHSALPIIGLGAGPHTDVIWLMVSDVLGITETYFALQNRKTPVFSPVSATGAGLECALRDLVEGTRRGEYPVIGQHTYALPSASADEIVFAVTRSLKGGAVV